MLDFFAITMASRAVSDQFSAGPEQPAARRRGIRRLLERLR